MKTVALTCPCCSNDLVSNGVWTTVVDAVLRQYPSFRCRACNLVCYYKSEDPQDEEREWDFEAT